MSNNNPKYVNLYLDLLNKFVQSKQTQLDSYFIKLKRGTKVNKSYQLVMSKLIYDVLKDYFCSYENNPAKLLTFLRARGQIEGVLNGYNTNVIDYEPCTNLLIILSGVLEDIKNTTLIVILRNEFSNSFNSISMNKESKRVSVNIGNIDFQKLKEIEYAVSVLNGGITTVYQYASSTAMRREIREFERPFKDRIKIIDKLLLNNDSNDKYQMIKISLDLGCCRNNRDDFCQYLHQIKVFNTSFFQDLKNKYNKSDFIKLIPKLQYGWNIQIQQFFDKQVTYQLAGDKVALLLHVMVYCPDEKSDSEEDQQKDENSLTKRMDLFKEDLNQIIGNRCSKMSADLDLNIQLNSIECQTTDKQNLKILLCGETDKFVNIDKKDMAIRFFGKGHL